jgi:peptidoglycan hydrolase FlgJ
MSGFAPIGVSPTLLAPTAQTTTADLARGKAKDVAQKFEAQFLSSMLQQMFEGVETGGGEGEQMFRSLMTEAMGKQMTKAGGIGLTDTIQREILKMQGLT